MMFSRSLRVLVGAILLSVALVTPSVAATMRPLSPYGPCGSHFLLYRSGSLVRIVGTNLDDFLGGGYGLVWPSTNGRSNGSFNASGGTGANFVIDTGSSRVADVRVALTDDADAQTLCASTYRV